MKTFKRLVGILFIVFFAIGIYKFISRKSPDSYKLYMAIWEDNEQGVVEALENANKINFNNLGKYMDSAAPKDALLLALNHNAPYCETPFCSDQIICMLAEKGVERHERSLINGSALEWAVKYNDNPEVTRKILECGFQMKDDLQLDNDILNWIYENIIASNAEEMEAKIQILKEYGMKLSKDTMDSCMSNIGGRKYAENLLAELRKNGEETGIGEELEAAIKGNDVLMTLKELPGSDLDELICYTAANCSLETVKHLKEIDKDFDKRNDKYGYCALEYAARYNSVDVLEYLYQNSEIADADPLLQSVIGAKAENVKYLLNQGLTWVEDPIDSQLDTWSWAMEEGGEESTQIMLDNGYKPPKENEKEEQEPDTEILLVRAILRGNVKRIHELLEDGADVNKEIYNRYYKLNGEWTMKSVEEKYVSCIEENTTYTPLLVAARCPSVEILKILMVNGGDIRKKDSNGKSAYEYACDAGFQDNMAYLEELCQSETP